MRTRYMIDRDDWESATGESVVAELDGVVVQKISGGMLTATIQIGNSDNKLTQSEWAHFCEYMRELIFENAHQIHFSGGSSFNDPWQNACWVCVVMDSKVDELTKSVTKCREQFKQDSVAITWGETEFV